MGVGGGGLRGFFRRMEQKNRWGGNETEQRTPSGVGAFRFSPINRRHHRWMTRHEVLR